MVSAAGYAEIKEDATQKRIKQIVGRPVEGSDENGEYIDFVVKGITTHRVRNHEGTAGYVENDEGVAAEKWGDDWAEPTGG